MDSFQPPVLVRTLTYAPGNIKIYYPQIEGRINPRIQQQVNQQIIQINQQLQQMQNPEARPGMYGEFAVKTNEKNILSIGFLNYAYTPMAAHGMTYIKSQTWDLSTGRTYQLKDLFKPGSNYVEVLNRIIKAQIKSQQIVTLEPFKSISPNQDYYIADKALVIYFQLYDLTAYAYGFPMFPISVFDLQNIIDENGPLGKMAVNGL
ncbi:RsiV family protein [Fictibacillus sp. b24]|uniref:RsiV family protein n=1 Tax=Fictibacillus sp. b24 TaxID=3055863 RepID=UPI0025A2D508|nr:RsiV family protein [Fictibacillus sp. b24]MDM5314753.1 RsiV family protein [Fictibacillus sp. b24]